MYDIIEVLKLEFVQPIRDKKKNRYDKENPIG